MCDLSFFFLQYISHAKHYNIVIEPTRFIYYGSIVSKDELDDQWINKYYTTFVPKYSMYKLNRIKLDWIK
jgi:hypothetical protein